MKAQLRIVTGTPAGTTHVFSKNEVLLGRHPSCDIQFDPHGDLEVSARHATVVRNGDHWIVRDLGSRNGTLLNGHRITADTRLDDTDHIRLGADGPVIEFRLVGTATADTRHPQPTMPRTSGSATPPQEAARPVNVTHRVRVEVAREIRQHRVATAGLLVALVAVIAGAIFLLTRQKQFTELEIAGLHTQIDSMLAVHEEVVRGLQGQLVGLADALRESQQAVRRLQGEFEQAQASGNTERIVALRRQLVSAMAALSARQNAAQINFERIRQNNQRAVAMVYVDFGNGEIATGTAFSIRSDATMVTNRHVVAGVDGTETPQRIGVQFADSEQVFPARVVVISSNPGIDLAILKVDNITGSVPTIQGFNMRPDTLRAGSPIAMIGFPLGMDTPMQRGAIQRLATTTLTAGIVSKTVPDTIQIHGFGAEGASGSPIFDAAGSIVGVLFGGLPGTGDRILFAVPSTAVTQLAGTVP